ncbi:MAG TPA: type II CAAX endopeptidase family protein [Bryobacteraceae bacterium]|nr:type II CAAX endopeptidase family protein [Bryobacteraceae bacterium]
MNPHTDQSDFNPPVELQPAGRREPFWDYADIFLFLFAVVASLVIATLIGVVLIKVSRTFLLASQIIVYALSFTALKVLFLVRYDQPFWRSLAWRSVPLSAAVGAILAGPVLALALGLLGNALRTPDISLPFDQLLGSRGAIILLGIVVVVLGPIAEELAFRGFLMPLLMRSLGVAAGIVLTGVLFGCMHGPEYKWSWQYMLLISLVGCVFGWARYRTNSTLTAAFMHSTFNLTQFAAFLVQSRSL